MGYLICKSICDKRGKIQRYEIYHRESYRENGVVKKNEKFLLSYRHPVNNDIPFKLPTDKMYLVYLYGFDIENRISSAINKHNERYYKN